MSISMKNRQKEFLLKKVSEKYENKTIRSLLWKEKQTQTERICNYMLLQTVTG